MQPALFFGKKWWRRRELNPRPGILRLSVYRLRSGFALLDESPLTRVPIEEPSLGFAFLPEGGQKD